MIQQIEFTLRAYPRGIHLITGEKYSVNCLQLPRSGNNQSADKAHIGGAGAQRERRPGCARSDLRSIFDRDVCRRTRPITCILTKGPTICPSHAKSVIVGSTLTLPGHKRASQFRHMAGNLSVGISRLRRCALNRGKLRMS